ncbi:MAG TPA: hypothetical protein VKV17_13980 [Bryobacteraceae bacterium]|nr:hypothetical protein [Bryobacteraceae bacterium]
MFSILTENSVYTKCFTPSAGADCGFSSQATYNTEIHPTVIWAKFQALAEGARLASKQLWK